MDLKYNFQSIYFNESEKVDWILNVIKCFLVSGLLLQNLALVFRT